MNRCTFALLFLATLPACGGRADAAYGACRASATCNEASPLCVSFRNRVYSTSIPLCTRECATNAECPSNGVCIEILQGGYRSLCMQRCTDDTECPFSGGFCANVRAGDMACVP